MTSKVMAISPFTGLLTEYHLASTVKEFNHNPTPPTPTMLKDAMSTQMLSRSIDGWCENVVMISRLDGDIFQFNTYIAATEAVVDAKTGQLVAGLVIPTAVMIVAMICATTVLLGFGFLVWTIWTTINESQTNRYVTDDGNTFKSKEEAAVYLHSKYWLVCPKCLLATADKVTYPNYSDVPQAEIDRFNAHVANCPGLPAPEQNYLTLIVGGVVIIGLIWLGGKALGFFGGIGKR